MKSLLKLSIILLVGLTLAQDVYGAEVAAITVSPVTKAIALSKDETVSGIFVVYNSSDETQHIYVEPRYWHMVDENRSIPIDSWLRMVPDEFDIGPKEKKEIAFNVSVPEEAIGELAVMIAFRPEPKKDQAINIVFSVSLYVRIKESEIIDCKVGDFMLWKFKDADALGAKVILKNLGNVHLRPKITVFIQNLFNENLQKADLRYERPTYPGKEQDYDGAIYNFKLRPGLYKAMIDGEFTNVPKRFRKKIYFIVGRNGNIIFTFFRRPKV